MEITEITVEKFQEKKEKDKSIFLEKLEDVDVLTFDFIMYNIAAIASLTQTHLTIESKKEEDLTIPKIKEISKQLQDKILYTMDIDPMKDLPDYIDVDNFFDLHIDSEHSTPKEINVLLLIHYSGLCDALIHKFAEIRDGKNDEG